MIAVAFPHLVALPRQLPPAPTADPCFSRDAAFVRRTVRAALGGYPLAEVDEVVQDVLIVAWQLLGERWPQGRSRALLRDIALKRCANWRRKRREVLCALPDDEPATPFDPIDVLDRCRLIAQVAERVLSPQDLQIFWMRFVLGLAPAEIVRCLLGTSGCGSSEIRVALQRIKRQIRAEMGRIESASDERLAGTAQGR